MTRAMLMLFCLGAATAPGQTPISTQKAELAVPFGVAPGKVITVGPYLLFVDDEKPESSLAVSREDIRDFKISGDVLTVATSKPVRDRSGERSQLTIRLSNATDSASLAAWYKAAPASPAVAVEAGKPATDTARPIYEAKHDHRIGACTGRLIVEPNRLLYESVTNIGHSREWAMRDIKELKRDNAYGIKVIPFDGETYNLGLLGQGMGNEEHRALVDRIAAARSSKQ